MAQFDRYADHYEDLVNASIGFLPVKMDYFTRVKAGYLDDALHAHFGKTDAVRLLDIGCGTGNVHRLIAPGVATIDGVDVSAASLDRARATNPAIAYSHYDGQRLPFADDQFDAAVTICVMHHVPPDHWRGFLHEMRRVVRPGGLAVVFEHNPRNPLTQKAVSSCELDDDAVLLPARQTCTLLAEAGFAEPRTQTILSIPTIGPISRKIDRALGRIGLGAQYLVAATA